jgi:hypothetical protein
MLMALVSLVLQSAVWAAAAAAIANLPQPLSVRILIGAFGVWCFWLLHSLNEIHQTQRRTEFWTRLVFITAHLRNEADGLPAARSRLANDLEEERIEKSMSGGDIGALIGLGTIAVLFSLLLHFGVLGPVGSGWIGQIFQK